MTTSDLVEVYVAPSSHEAYLLRASLEEAGIESRIVGDALENIIGEFPFGWWTLSPRVWVRSDDVEQARLLIARREQTRAERAAATPGRKWVCPQCGERVESTFDVCWKCQFDRIADSEVEP